LQFGGLQILVPDGAAIMIFEALENGACANQQVRRRDVAGKRKGDLLDAFSKSFDIVEVTRHGVLPDTLDEHEYDIQQGLVFSIRREELFDRYHSPALFIGG